MTALNKAALLAEVTEFLADNAIGAITPEILRGIVEDIVDSTITGAGIWNNSTAYAENELVTFNGGSYVAIVDSFNVQPGSPAAVGIWQALVVVSANQITDSGETGRDIIRAATPEAVREIISAGAIGRTPVNDVDYAASASDVYVGYIAITTARTVTLPAANTFPVGQPLVIADESGDCSETAPINIAAAGDDKIAAQDSLTMASLYQKIVLYSNGSDLWI